jgi:hypothetical protein
MMSLMSGTADDLPGLNEGVTVVMSQVSCRDLLDPRPATDDLRRVLDCSNEDIVAHRQL